MDQVQTWREFLGRIIADPVERQRIAVALEVNAITLSRWAANSSTPRPENVRHLIYALPQHQPLFPQLIAQEFPEFSSPLAAVEEGPPDIPASFYARILSTYADTTDTLYYWSVCKLILQQMLEQLDPRHLGILILIAQCTPPPGDGKVRSLRGSARMGTLPRSHTLEQVPLFFGAEALAGIVASSCRPHTVHNLEEKGLDEVATTGLTGATAYPVLRRGRIGGCLIVVSAVHGFFTPSRLALIQSYTNLLALAFQPEEFYEPTRIELGVMPAVAAQRPYFATFRQRIASAMQSGAAAGERLSNGEAEQSVWQQLEAELLQLPVWR